MFYEPEHGNIAFAARVDYRIACRAFSPHCHKQLELIFVESGVFRFSAGDQTEEFSAGDVYLVNCDEVHVGEVLIPGRYYYVQISLKQTPRGLCEELDELIEGMEHHRIRLPIRIPAAEAEKSGLFACGMELINCFSRKSGYNELKVLCKSLALLQLLSERKYCERVTETGKSQGSFEQQVAEYLDTHYAENLRLADLAEIFGYEPHYFCTLFKKTFLVGFTHYLRVVRVQKFLSHPNLNLQTIAACAADVGFSNYSYFYQSFRRVRGCSPKEFLMKTRK
ncbi:MAG: helix-turn-helix transcriptional regulator [Clostridia bacterium]|nr:helix-turn-helix transcriptional regulator [Clostridia bacterium]